MYHMNRFFCVMALVPVLFQMGNTQQGNLEVIYSKVTDGYDIQVINKPDVAATAFLNSV